MKKLILSLVLCCLLSDSLRAAVTLGTSDPPGTPLAMNSGTTSGAMYVTVSSDNPPNDVMAAWNFEVEIMAEPGATGTLSFQDPVSGTPANPPNYIFGADGLGIAATNSGNLLSANDFFNPADGLGTPVPGSPGANLLQMDFSASSSASGLFGIYAVEGVANTQWTDANFTTQLFANVPDGTGSVLIGEVMVSSAESPAVPEPSSLTLFCLGGTALSFCGWWRRPKNRPCLPN
jgi:hypothetical protein